MTISRIGYSLYYVVFLLLPHYRTCISFRYRWGLEEGRNVLEEVAGKMGPLADEGRGHHAGREGEGRKAGRLVILT